VLLRLPGLSLRPMHADEAVHAVKFAELWDTGRYVYDATEFHGPTLYYLTLPVVWIGGWRDFASTSEATYRVVPLIAGVATIVLTLLLADGLGRGATCWAALLAALSPGMVFYSRYYIQEPLLVCLTLLLIGSSWRFFRSRRAGWAVLAGVAAGLMHATKETSLIVFACLSAALVVTGWWSGRLPHESLEAGPSGPPVRDGALRAAARAQPAARVAWALALGALAAAGVSIALYSGFGRNMTGPIDSLRAYETYLSRAGGGIHEHPWAYYLRCLLYAPAGGHTPWSEAPILALGAVGAGLALVGRPLTRVGWSAGGVRLARLLTIFAVLLTGTYSAVPYKTPWCALGFLHAWALLAGVGAAGLLQLATNRALKAAAALPLLTSAVWLGWQSYRVDLLFSPAHGESYVRSHPYVYAQTSRDVLNLVERLRHLAETHPLGSAVPVYVAAPNFWPLPWYLRGYANVGYWDEAPPDFDAPIVIVSADDDPAALAQQDRVGMFYALRPDEMLVLSVERALWEAYLARHASAAARRDAGGPP
jgi:uncharacterized protein (TIGR03663 family)